MSLLDLVPTRIDPSLVEALQSDGNAAIMLAAFIDGEVDAVSKDGWFFLPRTDISQFTGLDNKAQAKAEKLLKQLKLIKIKKYGSIGNYYQMDQVAIHQLTGVSVKPTLVRKLRSNGDAAILFSFLANWKPAYTEEKRWFVCQSEILRRNTGLNEAAQKKALNHLAKINFLERKTSKGVVFYRFNLTTAKDWWKD
jgi:hypothetical protein